MSDDKKRPGRPGRPSRSDDDNDEKKRRASRRGSSLGRKIEERSGARRGSSGSSSERRRRRPARRSSGGSAAKNVASRQAAALRRARQKARLARARKRAEGASGGAAAAGSSAARRRRRPARRNTSRRSVSRSLSAEEKAQVEAIQDKFERLESEAQLPDVYDAIGRIESRLTELPLRLDELRNHGYVHGGQLEDRILAFDEQWDEIEDKVEDKLEEQVDELEKELDDAERDVDRLSAGSSSAIRRAERSVDSLERKVNAAERTVSSIYDDVLNELNKIEYRFDHLEKVLELFDTAGEIELVETEAPLEAVESEWHENGEEGPEGILFLTDQRLLFEQREEKSTKKLFGMVSTDKETIQRLRLDIPAEEIDSVKGSEEGGFMGMGKKDILELTCGAGAPVARSRFHIKGQESSDWAAMIKRVKSGDIDDDRDDDFVEEIEEAEAAIGTFPAECPNCYAPVPPPGRGVSSVSCEFCGATINPS